MRLSDLPDDLIADADALAVLEAAVAWDDAPFEDALTHAVLNDAVRGIRAASALRTAGVLDRAGRPGVWADAARALLADDPEGPALLARLCRYEGIVVQGYTLASGHALHAGLVPRILGDRSLLERAVAAGVGLAAADLAGAMLVGAVRAGPAHIDAALLRTLAGAEVAAARQGPDPARVDLALGNLAAVHELAGDAAGALSALRARLSTPPDRDDAVRIATIALRAGEDAVAAAALERAWNLLAPTDPARGPVALSLAQVRLALGQRAPARAALALAPPDSGDLAPDRALLATLTANLSEQGTAEGVHVALTMAFAAGPPAQGRCLDRLVRVARAGAVTPGALVRLVPLAEHARRAAEGPARARWDGWAVVLGFLVGWSAAPADPRVVTLARRADDVTGGAFAFGTWAGIAEA